MACWGEGARTHPEGTDSDVCGEARKVPDPKRKKNYPPKVRRKVRNIIDQWSLSDTPLVAPFPRLVLGCVNTDLGK